MTIRPHHRRAGTVITAAVLSASLLSPVAGATDDLDPDRVAEVVGAFVAARNAEIVGATPRGGLDADAVIAGVRVTAGLAGRERARREALAGRRGALGPVFDGVEQSSRTRELRRDGDHAVAVVTDHSRFRLVDRDAAEAGPDDHHELSTHRLAGFTRDAGGWRLTSLDPITHTGDIPTNEAPAHRLAAVDARVSPPPAPHRSPGAPGAPGRVRAVDKDAVLAYARRYWRDYNPDYRDYDDRGGDCTNFVSQAMRAGGWTDVAGPWADQRAWWHRPANESHSWISVEKFHGFTQHTRRTRIGGIGDLEVGDVLQVDFQNNGRRDHTMIVTRTRGDRKYLTYHSGDNYNKPLSVIEDENPKAVFTPHLT